MRCFYTDVSRASQLLDWSPRVGWRDGVNMLYQWVVSEDQDKLRRLYAH